MEGEIHFTGESSMTEKQTQTTIPIGWATWKILYEAEGGQWSYALQNEEGVIVWGNGDTQNDALEDCLEKLKCLIHKRP